MLFVYGRILSQCLVNTVTSDMVLYWLVSNLIKYHMVICYSLYIAGNLCLSTYLITFISQCLCNVSVRCLANFELVFYLCDFTGYFLNIVRVLLLWLSTLLLVECRIYVVHSHVEEEDVQVPIWPVCLDTHDSNCCIWPVLLHCGKHF